MRISALLMPLFFVACSNNSPAPGPQDLSAPPADLTYVPSALITARPYQSHVPTNYDATKPTPLVVLLHGYGFNGAAQNAYFGMTPVSDSAGFLYAYPDGTVDSSGKGFWNATDSCCNFGKVAVDDVAYLNAVIDDMSAQYNVDPKRIYFMGHSNGGFMTYRMACESGSRIAGVVVLAGAMWLDTTKCPGKDKVPVLHVHGDSDMTIYYGGSATAAGALAPYPGAKVSLADWATIDGCGPLATTTETKDLVTGPPNETAVSRHSCPTGLAAELWTIQGSDHVPAFATPTWPEAITTWLFQFHK